MSINKDINKIIYTVSLLMSLVSCAKMGTPDGGMYDETPPVIVSTSPADKGVNVKPRKININFNEFIKINNAQEKVIVSPPQLEQPEIKAAGKKVVVDLKDSLKENTTYTIDFSDAISDNNEDNPLGSYTYCFSTGNQIDTFEVSGKVLEAKNLEPIKGILVGLYNNLSDTIFTKKPMLRVSRTDSRGHFVIKGIASGTYRIYALNDADGNYIYNQKSEELAFSHTLISPSCAPAVRQDTLWKDTLHIDSIHQVPFTRFMPDNIVLLAFTEEQKDRAYLKSDRLEPNKFILYFSGGDKKLPKLRGLNFNDKNAFIVEPSAHNDTIMYWLRDSALCNQDTLKMDMQYTATDSTGLLVDKTDTVEVLSKISYAKRMKEKQKKYEEWKKEQEKSKKKGLPYETEIKPEALAPKFMISSDMAPDENVSIEMPAPLIRCDSAAVHLYAKHDTLWYKSKFIFRKKTNSLRRYEIIGEWRPGVEYSIEVDSGAFVDIYGRVSDAYKSGTKIGSLDSYSSLFITLTGMQDTCAVVQLLDKNDAVVREVRAKDAHADFYYLKPDVYYMRVYFDTNGNGKWDTGSYADNRQPETVYYYPKEFQCKAQWDLNETWNVTGTDIVSQKPAMITKQKADKKKRKIDRNAQRRMNS